MNNTPGRILLVEDDPLDLELIRLALETTGLLNLVDVDIVTDGEQAIQYLLGVGDVSLSRSLPQLVLMDLKLPKLNGVQVLQALRQNPKTRQLVIVVMTSSQEDSDLTACYSLGINSYIVKPLDHAQFLNVTQAIGYYWMSLNQPPILTA